MFDFFKKNDKKSIIGDNQLIAPVTGKLIRLSDVKDPVFSSGKMGDGFSLVPTEGKIVSPINATIISIAQTKHAFGLKANNGLEIILHLGIDTVNLRGKPFNVKVSEGQNVLAGQNIATMDLQMTNSAKLDPSVIFVITNAAEKIKKLQLNEFNQNYLAGANIGRVILK